MNLTQIEYFLTLSETLNFTAASKALYTTQPSLSRNIALMEEELKIKLFHRDKQMVQLTSSGKAFLPYAQRIKAAYDEAYAFAQSNAHGQEGEVRVGMATWLFVDLIPKLSEKMAQDCPKVKMSIRDGTQQDILKRLENRELDVIFTAGHSLHENPKMKRLLIDQIPLRVVVSKDHPLTLHQGPIPLSLLKDREENFFTVDCSSHPMLRKIFTKAEITLISSITRLLTLIEANMGIAILQDGVRRLSVQNVAFLEIEGNPLMMDAVAVWFEDEENLCRDKFLSELFELLDHENPPSLSQ